MDYIRQVLLLIATCNQPNKNDVLNELNNNGFINNIDEDSINYYITNDEQGLFDISFCDAIDNLDNVVNLSETLRNVNNLVLNQLAMLTTINNVDCVHNVEETIDDFIRGYDMGLHST